MLDNKVTKAIRLLQGLDRGCVAGTQLRKRTGCTPSDTTLAVLRACGFVEATRGAYGGYQAGVHLREITIGEVCDVVRPEWRDGSLPFFEEWADMITLDEVTV